MKQFKSIKTYLLAGLVFGAFLMSSILWRHIQVNQSARLLIAASILSLMYLLMIFELVHRTLAALIGAALSVAAYNCLLGKHLGLHQLLSWLDVETLALLSGMMIIVSVLGHTGLFDYLAARAYTFSAGRLWLLVCLVSMMTAVLSAFLDNVSTVLLMTPTLIKLSLLEGLDPRHLLIIMVLMSNIGGCATPVGDPPNLIIIGDPLINSLGITFGQFTAIMTPGALLVTIGVLSYIKLTYKTRQNFAAKKGDTEEIASSGLQCDDIDLSQATISDKPLLLKSLAVLLVTVLLFFCQSVATLNLDLGWISLFAGCILLVLVGATPLGKSHEHPLDTIIAQLEWSTLIFFSALFVVMEAMSKFGLILFLGEQVSQLIDILPAGAIRTCGAISIVLWSSGLLSAAIDNIPFTTMMIKVLASMAATHDVRPLVYALALGACLGGNGTLIGASANLVTAGMADKAGHPISFNRFFRLAAPATVISLVTVNIYLIVVFVLLGL